LPSLLARFAENVFWMARYLERAESLARIIDASYTYARGRELGPETLELADIYGEGDGFSEADKLGETALEYYILDRDNLTSIASAVASAQQNARSVRHLTSTEFWTQLNIFHNYMVSLTPKDVSLDERSRVCAQIKLHCQMIEGIAEGTLLRGEAWRFYQLGKYIERADQTTRMLDIGYRQLSGGYDEAMVSVRWNILLRSVAGYHAYRSRHPANSYASDVAAFLLYDREFARAVALCIDKVSETLRAVETLHGDSRSQALESIRREIEFTMSTGPGKVTLSKLQSFVDDLQACLGRLSNEIGKAYFS